MNKSTLGDEDNSIIKTHEEILELIEDIKKFEDIFKEFDLDSSDSIEIIPEFEEELDDESKPIPIFKEVNSKKPYKISKVFNIRFRRWSVLKYQKEKERIATTFRIRLMQIGGE